METSVHTFRINLNWKLLGLISQIDRFDAAWGSIEKKEGQSLKQLRSIATVRSVGVCLSRIIPVVNQGILPKNLVFQARQWKGFYRACWVRIWSKNMDQVRARIIHWNKNTSEVCRYLNPTGSEESSIFRITGVTSVRFPSEKFGPVPIFIDENENISVSGILT